MQEIEEDILIMLKNNSIERLKINPGDIFDEKYDQYVSIDYYKTTDEKKNGQIKDVKKYGYFLNNGEIKKPIRDAKIIVYYYDKGGK